MLMILPANRNTLFVDYCRERRLSRGRFEHYIRTKKPYLNLRLRIMDMVNELNTNRTYSFTFYQQ